MRVRPHKTGSRAGSTAHVPCSAGPVFYRGHALLRWPRVLPRPCSAGPVFYRGHARACFAKWLYCHMGYPNQVATKCNRRNLPFYGDAMYAMHHMRPALLPCMNTQHACTRTLLHVGTHAGTMTHSRSSDCASGCVIIAALVGVGGAVPAGCGGKQEGP